MGRLQKDIPLDTLPYRTDMRDDSRGRNMIYSIWDAYQVAKDN